MSNKLKVEVVKTTVRYGVKSYRQGEVLEIDEKYMDDKIFKFIEEVRTKPKTVDEMTVAELKAYAAEHEINLGDAKKRDDFVDAIKKAEAEKVEGDKNDGEGEGGQTPSDE